MLFESPFYIDFPVTIGVFFGVPAVTAIWLLVIFNRRGSFHNAVVDYFHSRQPGVPIEKWTGVGKFMFVFFAFAFGMIALFCVSVATGVVKSKDPLHFLDPTTQSGRKATLTRHCLLPAAQII